MRYISLTGPDNTIVYEKYYRSRAKLAHLDCPSFLQNGGFQRVIKENEGENGNGVNIMI